MIETHTISDEDDLFLCCANCGNNFYTAKGIKVDLGEDYIVTWCSRDCMKKEITAHIWITEREKET